MFVHGVQNPEEFYTLDIPAARSDRIHLVDGKLLTWYGPRMASSLMQLSAALRV
jgi:ABC-type hemin transport system substrate-binding protein